MGRRIRWLGLVLVLCFAAVLVQLVNIQLRKATAINASPTNPRNAALAADNQRGLILASTGKVLARSVKVPGGGCDGTEYHRVYTTGPLYAGVVGYAACFYGTAGVEYAYNTYLGLHDQKATTLGQLLNPPSATTDNITLTINPTLQADARQQLAAIPDSHQDGAIIVETVQTGAILADYSNPTFTNNALATPTLKKVEAAGQADFHTQDHEGFYPGYPMATFDAFAPGSTFKVVTSSAVYNLKPELTNFTFPVAGCTKKGQIPQTTKQVCNDATTPTAANPCGGTMVQMLPESCDPGYAMLGLAVGGTDLYKQARAFGYNQLPPIDLGGTVSKSYFPTPARLAPTGTLGLPGVALSAFGQQTVTTTDLQNVMVAEGVANTGNVMTPHVMSQIHNSTGGLVETYKPTVYKHAESASAAKSVNALMQRVPTTPKGTAYGVGFPSWMHIAVKTGTAQAGLSTTNTTDWMVGFAPAYAPKIAISVVVPYQAVSASGASIAGPIMKTMMADSLALVSYTKNPPPTTSTSTTAPPPTSTTTTSPPTTFPAATPTTSPPTTTTPTTSPATATSTPATGATTTTSTTTAPAATGATGAAGAAGAPATRERRAAVHAVRSPP